MSRITTFALLLGISLFAGCGEDGPPMGAVSGTVKIGGKAPPEPILVYFTNSNQGYGSGAKTNEEGEYSLDSEIPVSEYAVYFERIVESTGPISTVQEQLTVVPPKYRTEMSTPLKEKVVEGDNTIDFDLPAAK